MEFYKKMDFEQSLQNFRSSLLLSEALKDSSFMVTNLNNIGSSLKHLSKPDSALLNLETGIQIAHVLDNALYQQIKLLPDSIRNQPNFPELVRQYSHEAVLERLNFHKAGCLIQLDRKEEAEEILNKLKAIVTNRNDQKFLKEIEEELSKI